MSQRSHTIDINIRAAAGIRRTKKGSPLKRGMGMLGVDYYNEDFLESASKRSPLESSNYLAQSIEVP